MPTDQEQQTELVVDLQLGINNAVQPTSLPKGAYLQKRNAYQNLVGSNAKRPGSVPVITSALVATIQYLTTYNVSSTNNVLLAASGTSLYKFDDVDTLVLQTMTNILASANIYTVGFTNLALTSILFITDGGAVKKYNGTAVALIAPAADDVAPAPVNSLAAINLTLPKYCWVFKGHLFISIGDDTAWHSKYGQFDYFPSTFTTKYVRNNDYITGCGVPYGDVCLVPMRQGWGVTTYSSAVSTLMTGNQFLNTPSGNVAPRAIQKVTYPDGSQTVVYLSDDGVYEIYDSGFIDSSGAGSRSFATRSLMKNKINFTGYGFTSAEMTAAEAYFDSTLNLYMMTIKRSTTNYVFVYDVRTKEWDLWDGIKAESTVRYNGTLYYAGNTKFLHKYDSTLARDWDDKAKTTGTIVDWDCYTDVIMLENTGYQSIVDWIIVNAKNFPTSSSIDITIVGTTDTSVYTGAVQSRYASWDVSLWDFSVLANLDFTTIVGAPAKTKVKKRSFFFQIRFRNNRDELVELYKYKIEGRVSGN